MISPDFAKNIRYIIAKKFEKWRLLKKKQF